MGGTPGPGRLEEERCLARVDLGLLKSTHVTAPRFASLLLRFFGFKYENYQTTLFTAQQTFTEHLTQYRFRLKYLTTPQASAEYVRESAVSGCVKEIQHYSDLKDNQFL